MMLAQVLLLLSLTALLLQQDTGLRFKRTRKKRSRRVQKQTAEASFKSVDPFAHHDPGIREQVCRYLLDKGSGPIDFFLLRPGLNDAQISSLCNQAWKPMNACTKGDCDLFKTSDGNFIVKQMHEHEAVTLRSRQPTEGLKGNGTFIAPFYAGFHLDGRSWVIMPNILTQGEHRLYDIKGVTNPKYEKEQAPFRDPNWVADYRHHGTHGNNVFIGIPKHAYLRLIQQLADDVDLLTRYNAVDYSMLVAVFAAGSSNMTVGEISMTGKQVWPAYDFAHKQSTPILLAGIIDVLEGPQTPRRLQGPEEDISRAFYFDAGVYACRLFWFISTQMLTPCDDVENGRSCVQDFGPLLEGIFGPGSFNHPVNVIPPVNNDFLVTGCKYWSQHQQYKNIASVVPKIEAFVRQQLDQLASLAPE